ncbi:hypothetical protein GCG54_00011694 [Colletotrichum gloeosporioides]|uniref:Late endosomal/lysosomal adaptor and MAPK and MTOR activator-domain-containing protein n=2 Tax=Colletotrichum gloeosporioides species complex TaxID=2707338 RepID=A0A8H4C5A4_COLGL|nr:uncharacterized protein GCG54_00011694 [Colletotrichum gloeosporioides]KAF3797664.1 hypothetical protein GCG54_00011694 [Colletotrichum gloeosporioides]CAI0646407.1 unnamed protein product [Colletotrichum noveboracense]
MGACASCLGRGNKDVYDEDEESRLLYDDPNNVHYGSFGEQSVNGQEDPMEVQRETEALQRVVAKTSENANIGLPSNMVDIFEIAPQDHAHRPAPTTFAYAGQEARIVRYQHLLSKLDSKDETPTGVQVDWLPQEDDTIEMQRGVPTVKTELDKPLVGTFADAAAAMA